MELPDWLDPELWQLWIDYRREDKGKPASERSQKMTLRKLERLREEGYDATLLLETAIEREWQGIYANDGCKIIKLYKELQSGPGRKLSAVEQFRTANMPRARLRSVGNIR